MTVLARAGFHPPMHVVPSDREPGGSMGGLSACSCPVTCPTGRAARALVLLSLALVAMVFGPLVVPAVGGPVATTTIAGSGGRGSGGDGGSATLAKLDNPFGVVRGPDGAIWFCEYDGQVVRRIAADGTLSTVAGTGRAGYAGDGGPAKEAMFDQPHEVRFDREGNLFVADMKNHAVRRVDAKTQVITTFAGIGRPGYSGDGGPATDAALRQPHSIQFSPDGDLFIADIGNYAVRRVDRRTGRISTFAGTGKPGPTPDGAAIAGTPLNGPRSIDFDVAGDLWLATREGNQVFRFDRVKGIVRHVAGTGAKGFAGNGGPAKDATFAGPKGISVGPGGDVYLADTENHAVRKIDVARGTVELVVGAGTKGDGPDGDPLGCRLARPHGVFVDKDGTLFIGDSENHRVRSVRPR